MTGVAGIDLAEQSRHLGRWVPQPLRDVIASQNLHFDACVENSAVGYGRIEAELFYAFIVTNRPGKIIQIGSGVSTAIALKAKQRFNLATELICIDPYPTDFLVSAAAREDITLLTEPAQTVPMDVFEGLGAGDILFIDSTHTVKVGSEVNWVILDVLPCLKAGVYVHFHDIYFPYDYGPDTLHGDLFHWNESVLLHAFLINNKNAAIQVSCSMLHHGAPECLTRAFPHYNRWQMVDGIADHRRSARDFPSAIYLQMQ